MKINTIISPRLSKKSFNSKSQIRIISFVVVAASIISGTVICNISKENTFSDILMYFREYMAMLGEKNSFEIFSAFLLAHVPYITLMIVFGTCTYGFIFVILLSFIKISGLSIVNALIYSDFGLKGVEYSLLVFYPGKFILILSVIVLMELCIENSLMIKNHLKGECKQKDSNNFYAPKVATAVLLFILSSLTDCFFNVSFSSLFTF